MCTVPVARRFCRESYTSPVALYEQLKRSGMDLVTVTDHDSIDAVECLRRHPDFFLSEEVTVEMPGGTEAHVGVYGITETQHIELQRRRRDLPSLLAFMREQGLFFTLNHAFSGLTGRRTAEDFEIFLREFPAWEVRNGAMLARTNRAAEQVSGFFGKTQIGGSDAHTLLSAGRAWTEVAGAHSKEEFLAHLAAGHARPCGGSGNWFLLTREVLGIAASLMEERRWTRALAPLALLIPVITLANYANEVLFAERWRTRLAGAVPAFDAEAV